MPHLCSMRNESVYSALEWISNQWCVCIGADERIGCAHTRTHMCASMCVCAVECDACGLAWMKFWTDSYHKITQPKREREKVSTCQLLHWHYRCYLVANTEFSVFYTFREHFFVPLGWFGCCGWYGFGFCASEVLVCSGSCCLLTGRK